MALFLAVRYGKTRADTPSWLTTLVLAEKWGMYPGDLEKARGSIKWAARQSALDEQRKRSADMDRK